MTDLSGRLANLSETQRALLNLRLEAKRLRPEPIAIIGIGCRFPGGADSLDAFWRLLRDGVDAITEVPADALGRRRLLRPRPGRAGQDVHPLGRVPRRDAIASTPTSSGSPRARRRRWTRSSGCCWRWPGRRWRTPGMRAERLAGTPTGVFVGISTDDYRRIQIASDLGDRSDAYVGTGGAASASPPTGSRTCSTCAARAWPSTPRAPRRWWRSTWPARACGTARVDWRSPAAST